MLQPENRVELLLSGMENIDILQEKTIAQAKKNIIDYEAFQKSVHRQFEKSIREYRKMVEPIQIDDAVNDRNKIIDYLKRHKDEFEKKYNISKLALFGSYSRGENRKDSDIDIAIETKLSDYFLLYDFKEELEGYFHTKVDVVRIRDRMNEALRKRIMKDGIYV